MPILWEGGSAHEVPRRGQGLLQVTQDSLRAELWRMKGLRQGGFQKLLR